MGGREGSGSGGGEWGGEEEGGGGEEVGGGGRRTNKGDKEQRIRAKRITNNDHQMNIKFCGAAGTVTGSSFADPG